MSYTINGIPLDNPSLGWTLVRGSIPVLPVEINNPGQERMGIDGVKHYFATRRPSSFVLTIKSSLATRGDLTALLTRPSLTLRNTENVGWEATGRLISATVDEYHEKPGWAKDTFVIEIPGGAWRSEITNVSKITPGSTQTLFNKISAPVQDAMIRFQGPIQNGQVVDLGSGSYLAITGTIPAGQYLRFEMDTWRGWITTTNTWTGGTEATGNIDFGGPRGVFEITPRFTVPSDPNARQAELQVTATSFSTPAGVEVRGRNAMIL